MAGGRHGKPDGAPRPSHTSCQLDHREQDDDRAVLRGAPVRARREPQAGRRPATRDLRPCRVRISIGRGRAQMDVRAF